VAEPTIYRRLLDEPYLFDFFQSVRLLGRLPAAKSRTKAGAAFPEVARFKAHASLAFPASAIQDLQAAADPEGLATMTVNFMGLTGPSGVLPLHYTETILILENTKGAPLRPRANTLGATTTQLRNPEYRGYREWLDLFNHRFIDLFYRAWSKYRFWMAHERGETDLAEPDRFTLSAYSLFGFGTASMRDRLKVVAPGARYQPDEVLAKIHDLGLLRFAGLLSQRHRSAWGLQALLAGYFERPVEVLQFQGQWLPLDVSAQTRMPIDDPDHPNYVPAEECNCDLGVNMVAGDRVWDVQGKVRIRLGPLRYNEFLDYLPDRTAFHPDGTPLKERKSIFLLAHLARLYLGPEIDIDIQLILRRQDVPECRLTDDPATGPRLGWNCWALAGQATKDADDAIFPGEAITHLGEPVE